MSSPIVPFRTQPEVTAIYQNAALALNNSLQVLTPGDWYDKANTIGSVGAGLSQDLFTLQKQMFSQTASGSSLDSQLANLNLAPRAGNLPAIGQIAFASAPSGTVTVAQGTIFTNSSSNINYVCSETTIVTIANFATTYIPIASSNVGSGNITAIGQALTATPIGGVSLFTVITMADGVTSETDGEVAGRIQFAFQNPPGGGSISDFRNWALQTTGVNYAEVFNQFNLVSGLNSIYVSIFAGNADINTALLYDGLQTPPSGPPTWVTYSRNASALVPQVANYISGKRPVNDTVIVNTTDTYIVTSSINVSVSLAPGYTLTTIIPNIGLTCEQLIQREVRRAIISVPPGGIFIVESTYPNGVYQIPISLIAQTLDIGLSASPYQTGIYASILIDRDILINNLYQFIAIPSISDNTIFNTADGNCYFVYDVVGSTLDPYSNIIVTIQ